MVLSGVAIKVFISDCIFESAARIAAVSMPNCPFARVGRMASTASTTAAAFNKVGRYQGCAFLGLPSTGFTSFANSVMRMGLRCQKKDLRCLFGLFFEIGRAHV